MNKTIENLKSGKEVLVSSATEIKAKFANGEMFLRYEGSGWIKTKLTIEEVAEMIG